MNILLAHGDFSWLLGGVVVFLGVIFFIAKFMRGHYFAFVASAMVWVFVFSLHSGSTAGIMTATFATFLFDLFGLPILKLLRKV